MKTSHGFSLVELLVTVTLVAILLAVGIPSYRSIATSNRMAGEMNALLGDLQLARSEAVKQGTTVTICPTSSPAAPYACSNSGNWSGGWVVFVGGSSATSSSPMRLQPALGGIDVLQSNSTPAVKAVSFNRNGFSTNTGSITLNDANSTADRRRCAVISIAGHISLQSGGTCP